MRRLPRSRGSIPLADAVSFEEVRKLTDNAMSGELDLQEVYSKRLSSLRPTREAVNQIRDTYRRYIVPGAAEVVSALLELGHDVYVVSGGLADPVREFAVHLGIPVENVRAVETHHDTLSGKWWTHDDSAGQTFVGHEESPLVTSSGKVSVIRDLLAGKSGRSVLIGDGLTDLLARDEVDFFVGFGGVASRIIVAEGADVYISGASLDPVLAIAGGTPAASALKDDRVLATLERGLDEVSAGRVTFSDSDVERRFRNAFDLRGDLTTMAKQPKREHTVLVCDALGDAGMDLLHGAEEVEVRVETELSSAELLDAVSDVDAIIVRSATTIDATVIDAAERLRIVGRSGVGTDNIDLDAATRRGVMVTNTPHANTIATAEQTLVLMLASARHTHLAHGSMTTGEWNRSAFHGYGAERPDARRCRLRKDWARCSGAGPRLSG